MVVEVFKTNVIDPGQARMLVDHIHKSFRDYKANFDLEDCDNILRVITATGFIRASCLINLLNELGFEAEVLPEE